MGLLDRLRGKKDAPPVTAAATPPPPPAAAAPPHPAATALPPPPAAPPPPPAPDPVVAARSGDVEIPSGRRDVKAAGAGYQPDAWKRVPLGPITVTLRPEPKNEYDPRAFAVYLPTNKRGAYLPGWFLDEHHSLLVQLASEGVITASADVVDIGDERTAVLHLPYLDELTVWCSLPAGERMWPLDMGGAPAPIEFDPPYVEIPACGGGTTKAFGVRMHQTAFAGYEPGPVMVELRPSPTAEEVDIYLPSGAKAGFITRWESGPYAVPLRVLAEEGRIVLRSELDTWEEGMGITMPLMEVSYLERWIQASAEERDTMPLRTSIITLAGGKDHADAITRALGKSSQPKSVLAEVRSVPTASGKYKGQPRLVFEVNGEPVGHLLPTRQEQLPDLFAAAAAQPIQLEVDVVPSSNQHKVQITVECR